MKRGSTDGTLGSRKRGCGCLFARVLVSKEHCIARAIEGPSVWGMMSMRDTVQNRNRHAAS